MQPGPGVVETDAPPGGAVVEDDGDRARDGDQDLLQASVGVTAAAAAAGRDAVEVVHALDRERDVALRLDDRELVGESLRAQLRDRLGPLLETSEPHPCQDPVRLRELDVTVVDHLDVVPPRVAEVVVAEQFGTCLPGRGKRRGAVVDDEADVPRAVRPLLASYRERNELVAQIDERHRAAVAPTQGEVEDPSVEGERLLQVAYLQRDVVDPDCPRHRDRLAVAGGQPVAPYPLLRVVTRIAVIFTPLLRNRRTAIGVYAAVVGRPQDESELVARARRGDRDAYEELVHTYQGIAFRTAYVVAGNAADAEEAAQDGFVKAYRALWRFRAGADFKPWLLRIVANEARNRRRSAGRRSALALRAAQEPSGEAAPSPEATLLGAERREQLLAALNRLGEQDREAVACRYFLDLSEAETAAALGVRPGTVKSRLSRALVRLRAELGDEEP